MTYPGSRPACKEDLARMLEWYNGELADSRITLKLNTEVIPKIVEQNVCEPPSSSLSFKNHKSITLEEDDDEIVIEFDDEYDSESKIELEIDPDA